MLWNEISNTFNISFELAELILKSYHKKFEHTVSFETTKENSKKIL